MTAARIEVPAKSMAEAKELLTQDTEVGEKARLMVEYATREGGITLRYWKLKHGPLFGETGKCTMEWCAKELDLPLSDIVDINTRGWKWIQSEAQLRRSTTTNN